MSEWKEYILEDIIEKFIDYRGKTPVKTTTGIPLITAKIIKNGRIEETQEFISSDNYIAWMNRGFPELNDIVLTTEAPLGEVALLRNEKVALAQRVIVLQTKKNICNSIFLKYYFQSEVGQNTLKSRASGSTVEGIKAAELKKISVSIPSLSNQSSIAEILISLDDKIDLLHRQNKTLEQMAETLFRQWFVEEAEESWEEGKLESLAFFSNGKSRPDEVENGNVPIYGGNGVLGFTNRFNYNEVSIIIGRVGAYCGSLYIENRPIWLSDNALLARSLTGNNFFLFYQLKRLELNSMAEGSSHPLLTQTLLKSIDLIIPPIEKIVAFESQAKELWKKIYKNIDQIKTLTQLRDTLLPKLMSGEVRVDI